MDPLTQLDVLVPVFQAVVAGSSTDQLDDATPCDEWRVRHLFGHLLDGATTFAALVRGAEPPTPPRPADRQLAATVGAAVADLDHAFRGRGALARVLPTPFGEMDGETFARLLSFDLLVHTWDLGCATGSAFQVDDEVVAAVDGFARAVITSDLRRPGLFGPEVAPPEGAGALDRLAAFAGRRR